MANAIIQEARGLLNASYQSRGEEDLSVLTVPDSPGLYLNKKDMIFPGPLCPSRLRICSQPLKLEKRRSCLFPDRGWRDQPCRHLYREWEADSCHQSPK